MFTKRIIPCLDVNNGRVVKGVNFVNLIDAGDPVMVAKAYDAAGADEVVFLDIYMEDENGVEVAKELRSFDRNCILVFTTTSTDHALDGFKVRALQYLVKPYADEELNAVFKEII